MAPAARPVLRDLKPLTDQPKYVHQFAGISPDGRLLAYVSNKANGVDFDLWVCDLGSGEHKCVFAGGGWCRPASGFSPDGRFVSVSLPGPRPLDDDLLLVELATGEVTNPLPHPDEAAQVGPPAWVDATTFYASSNVGRDFAAIVQYKLGAGVSLTLPGTGEGHDAQVFSSPDGASLVVITNQDGASQVRIFGPSDWSVGDEVPFPRAGSRLLITPSRGRSFRKTDNAFSLRCHAPGP